MIVRMFEVLVVLAIAAAQFSASVVPAAAGSRCFAAEHTLEWRSMRGRIDADGIRDEVWVGARRVDSLCRYYVFARASTTGTSRVHVPTPDKFSRVSMRDWARPVAMVRIDQVTGREIAVKLLEGASVRPFGFFTMRLGSLRRMAIDSGAPPLGAVDMFAFGGGLSLMYGTDCAYRKAPRTLVFSRAYPNDSGPRYVVERRWFQVRGHDFVRTLHPTQRELIRLARLRDRFPEFRNGGLLPRCDGKVLDARNA